MPKPRRKTVQKKTPGKGRARKLRILQELERQKKLEEQQEKEAQSRERARRLSTMMVASDTFKEKKKSEL